MNIRQTLTTVALALSVSVGASAAMIKGTHSSVTVNLSDLDLTTVEDRQIMRARLKRAAKDVCGPQDILTAGSLDMVRKHKACYQEAFTGAVESVENHYLTAFVN